MLTFKKYAVLQLLGEYITKTKNKYVVHAKSGRVLGTHPTKTAARKQLAAVEINKRKK